VGWASKRYVNEIVCTPRLLCLHCVKLQKRFCANDDPDDMKGCSGSTREERLQLWDGIKG
jgi:hypothetical protein